MPIQSGDLVLHLSQPNATRGMAAASTPAESLGGYVSTVVWDDSSSGLFPDITGAQNDQGHVDARCLFVHNRHADLPLLDAIVWIDQRAETGAMVMLAVDPTTSRAARSPKAQALFWDPSQPLELDWREADGQHQAVPIGTIPAGQVKAFWIRRQAHQLPALKRDFFVLRLRGDTAQ